MEPTTIIMAISAVISVASAIYASTLVTDTSGEDAGSTVTKTGVSATKNPIYGKCRVGSVNVYNNVKDSNSKWLISAFTVGIGPLNAIHQVYIDDVEALYEMDYVSDPNGGTNQLIIDGTDNFSNQGVQIQLRTGLERENAMGMVIDNSDGEWTTEHRGDRCGQVAVKVRREISDEGARILSPQFSVSALVSGLSVYDPRIHTDPTQKAFSRNTALCVLDYITNDYYGMGIPYKYIDQSSFIDCANWVDANGLQIDAEIDSSETFSTILSKMIACFGGIIIAEDGYIKLKYEDVASPRFHFTEDNIVSDGIRVTNQNSSGYYNVVETSFKNFNTKERQDIYTLPPDISKDPRIASDGYTKSTKLELDYVVDGRNGGVPDRGVKLLANRMYNRSNFQKKVDFDVDLEEYPLNIYDVIEISNEHYGWNKKKWRVISKDKAINEDKLNIATVSCDEYDDSIYSGTQDGNTGKPLPDPPKLTAPTNLKFNQQTYITVGYGELTWNATSFGQSNETQVEYKRKADAGWTALGKTPYTLWKVSNLSADVYMFRVRTYNPVIGTSPWTVLDNVTIAPNVILPSVTGATADTTTPNFVFTWDDMLDAPVATPNNPDNGGSDGTVGTWFSYYQIDIFHWNGSGYDYKSTYSSTTPEYVYTLSDNMKNGINRQIRAEVYIVAKDGTKSSLGAGSSYNATNPQHAAPSGVEISTELSNTIITWDRSTELDYDHTNMYVSKTQGFIPSGSDLVAQPVGTLYSFLWDDTEPRYIRFAHNDSFGSVGQILSPEYVAIPTPIDQLLPKPVDELRKIRDPSNPLTDTGEYVGNVASSSKKVVTGFGMFANDSGQSDFIVAADRFMVGAGGHAVWDATTSYVVGDRVFLYNPSTTNTDLYEAVLDNINIQPPSSEWTLVKSDVDQVVFSVDASGKVLIKNAVIENLNGSKITAHSITATQIEADTITGNEISSATTVTAGYGANTAGMNGYDVGDNVSNRFKDIRFWSGAEYPRDVSGNLVAPYYVNKTGYLYANNATIAGTITATRGYFQGQVDIGRVGTSSNYVRMYGQNSSGTTNEFMRMYRGGRYKYRQFYSGRTIWYGTSNNIVADFNPDNGSFTFNGTVYADKIVGDVVTAIRKSSADKNSNSTSWLTFGSVAVTSSRPYSRTLTVNVVVESHMSSRPSGSDPKVGTAQGRMTGTFGTVYTNLIYCTQSDTSTTTSSLVMLSVNVPANTTGTMTLQIKGDYVTGSQAWMKGHAGTIWTAQLFKNGSDLG